MWYIISPAAAAKSTSERQNGDWRQDWRNTRMPARGDDGDVSYSGACVEEPPPDPLGGDDHTGPWQRTGAVGEGGPAHPDDTCRGALQPRWRTGSPWLLDCCDEEAGREEQSSLTFDLQLCVSSVVQASNVRTFSTFTLMTTGAFSQNISKVIFQTFGNR